MHSTSGRQSVEKKEFRARALLARDGLPPDERREKSSRIVERLLRIPEISPLSSWFVYVSFRSEVETEELITRLLAAGKKVSVPAVDPASRTMVASLLLDLERDLAPGCLGILEPTAQRLRPVPACSVEVVIAPGAAFSEDGHRIGYGGGYYDRFLKSCGGALAVGLAYDIQIFDRVPHYPERDQPVSYIVTESRLIRPRA